MYNLHMNGKKQLPDDDNMAITTVVFLRVQDSLLCVINWFKTKWHLNNKMTVDIIVNTTTAVHNIPRASSTKLA